MSALLKELSDGPVLPSQGHGTADPERTFASAVPLQACCGSFSLSGIYYGVHRCGEISTACNTVCLSRGNIPFYWTFLPVVVKKMVLSTLIRIIMRTLMNTIK